VDGNYYAGGGGGACRSGGTGGSGGNGGGGAGGTAVQGTAGTAGTGGGGGGSDSSGSVAGANGGSGIVIIRYAGTTQLMAGGTVTVANNTVIHTFTNTGYLSPLKLLNGSLRFRASAGAYLNRTPGSTGNQKTWTVSFWCKRTPGANQDIFGPYYGGDGTNESQMYFRSDDTFQVYDSGAVSGYMNYITTQVFRDAAAWYHIVVACDTTQSNAANRLRIYVNGVQVTSFSTSQIQNQNNNTGWNGTSLHRIGCYARNTTQYFDGYLAEFYNIDGQALGPNAFGAQNQYGQWQPIAYRGSYGINGFYLPFSNTTSTTTLGYDFSNNNNNWTTNNISLTTGVTYDAMTDVPTLTSATAANYPVLNPLFDSSVSNSNGNLQTVLGTGSISTVPASMGFTSGKYYCEVTYVATGANGLTVGLTQSNLSTANQYNWSAGGIGYRSSNGYSNTNGAGQVAYGATWTTGDVIGIAVDTTANTITFYKNGTSQGALTLPTLTTGASWLFSFSNITSAGTQTMAANFGQQPFAYTPPTGFVALNTYNLP